jgi:hypothetical protein
MSEALKALGALALAAIGLLLIGRRAPLATRDKTTPGYWRERGRIRRLIGFWPWWRWWSWWRGGSGHDRRPEAECPRCHGDGRHGGADRGRVRGAAPLA